MRKGELGKVPPCHTRLSMETGIMELVDCVPPQKKNNFIWRACSDAIAILSNEPKTHEHALLFCEWTGVEESGFANSANGCSSDVLGAKWAECTTGDSESALTA